MIKEKYKETLFLLDMKIPEKVLEIYEDYRICLHCIGRMFSLLATNTTNFERGYSILLTLTMQLHQDYLSSPETETKKILSKLETLAEKAKFLPAQKVLENEGYSHSVLNDEDKCYLCQDIFFNLNEYANAAIKKLEGYEYESILVGTKLSPEIINREDVFKSEYGILESESFKSHFNREIGKIINQKLNKPTEFNHPDITIIFSLEYDSFTIDLIIKSLYIYGKYNKFLRGIPQTHWDCGKCQGRGCEVCNFSGKQYSTSVEELINKEFKKASNSEESKFHGAGREDIDVKMLGEGRPFILELKTPTFRNLSLDNLMKKVNKQNKNKVKIQSLRFSSRNEVKKIKSSAEHTKKIYHALIKSPERKFSKSEFRELKINLIKNMKNNTIVQRTPNRVSHRRADKIRKKKLYNLSGSRIKSNLFEFNIETQGGTYIKELINGDGGRTTPSFAEIFGTPLICKELDVIQIGF